MSKYEPPFYFGVVEARDDPLQLGRVRVRVLGIHTHDKSLLMTEDLPWAAVILPTTSGSLGGMGTSPTGMVEGTWVVVQYCDPDKQMPFVIGTLAGTHNGEVSIDAFKLYDDQNNVVDTAAAAAEEQKPVEQKVAEADAKYGTKKASEYTLSEPIFQKLKQSEAFRPTPYNDGVGVWTIGYGSTYLRDGSRVTQNTPAMTREEAESLMRYKIQKEFEPAVKSKCRVPITQSMYDSLVHLTYNVGGGGIGQFCSQSGLNSGNYEDAATYMLTFKINLGTKTEKGLRNRRAYEKDLFLKDGVPKKDGSGVSETPQSKDAKAEEVKKADPTVSEEKINRDVYQIKPFEGASGFGDPSKSYPEKQYKKEPDVNRLARHEKVRESIVYVKETAEVKDVSKANGKGTWSQAPTPYAARYPFNNVKRSESGHVFEMDDTTGHERIHVYHRTGTFVEIDHNGTQVNRIVGDNFQILERNGHVAIMGNLDISVKGAKSLIVHDTMDVQINGKCTVNIHDKADINVASDLNITSGGNIKMKAAGNLDINIGGTTRITTASSMDLKSGGAITSSASGKFDVRVASEINMDGSTINLNSNKAGNAADAADTPTIPAIGGEPVDMPDKQVLTRGEKLAMEYEAIETDAGSEKTANAYKVKAINEGVETKQQVTPSPGTEPPAPTPQESTTANNKLVGKPVAADVPPGTKTFTGQEQLSKYFKLADLTDNYKRKLIPQNGFSEVGIFENLKALAVNCLDPVKAKYPNMWINSGFRRPGDAPASSPRSQHNNGQAADMIFPNVSRSQLHEVIKDIQTIIPYDQLILEYLSNGGNGWIHVSFNNKNPAGRKQLFTMVNHKRVSPNMYTLVKPY